MTEETRMKGVFTAFLIGVLTVPAFGTTCECKKHPAAATAEGTCSLTEDVRACSIAFDATSPEEYARYRDALVELGLELDPHDVLTRSREVSPRGWEDPVNMTLVLFSVSQKDRLARFEMEYMRELIMVARESDQYSRALDVFSSPEYKRAVKRDEIGEFELTASYGCLDLERSDFRVLLKTQWSEACTACDDFLEGEE